MGAFLYIDKSRPGETDRIEPALAIESMRERGLAEKQVIARPEYDLYVYRKRRFDCENVVEYDNGDFIVATGTLLYRGRSGGVALRELFADSANGAVSFEHLLGHYGVWICRDERLTLFNDPSGFYQIYHDQAMRVVSSSFVALCDALPRVTPNDQEVFEYLALEYSFANKTIVAEVERLDARFVYELQPQPAKSDKALGLPDFDDRASFDDQADAVHGQLKGYFRSLAESFGDDVSIGLSGGYDSRIVLAYLRACGVSPAIYVHGAADSRDVRASLRIAAGEGLDIDYDEHVASVDFPLDALPDRLRFAWGYLDGVSHSGLFDGFALASEARAAQERTDRLRLYGMGGEILRRVIALPDRPCTLPEYFAVKYDRTDRTCFGPLFDNREFYDNIAAKTIEGMNLDGPVLSRLQVEAEYPRFRMSRISGPQMTVQNERAHALVAFGEPWLIASAERIPLEFRANGRFVAALLQRTCPSLADYPTDAGHTISAGPGRLARVRNSLQQYLPPTLRSSLYQLRTRLQSRKPMPFYLQDDALARIFPDGCPNVEPYIELAAVKNPRVLSRALTLEILLSGRFRIASAERADEDSD